MQWPLSIASHKKIFVYYFLSLNNLLLANTLIACKIYEWAGLSKRPKKKKKKKVLNGFFNFLIANKFYFLANLLNV